MRLAISYIFCLIFVFSILEYPTLSSASNSRCDSVVETSVDSTSASFDQEPVLGKSSPKEEQIILIAEKKLGRSNPLSISQKQALRLAYLRFEKSNEINSTEQAKGSKSQIVAFINAARTLFRAGFTKLEIRKLLKLVFTSPESASMPEEKLIQSLRLVEIIEILSHPPLPMNSESQLALIEEALTIAPKFAIGQLVMGFLITMKGMLQAQVPTVRSTSHVNNTNKDNARSKILSPSDFLTRAQLGLPPSVEMTSAELEEALNPSFTIEKFHQNLHRIRTMDQNKIIRDLNNEITKFNLPSEDIEGLSHAEALTKLAYERNRAQRFLDTIAFLKKEGLLDAYEFEDQLPSIKTYLSSMNQAWEVRNVRAQMEANQILRKEVMVVDYAVPERPVLTVNRGSLKSLIQSLHDFHSELELLKKSIIEKTAQDLGVPPDEVTKFLKASTQIAGLPPALQVRFQNYEKALPIMENLIRVLKVYEEQDETTEGFPAEQLNELLGEIIYVLERVQSKDWATDLFQVLIDKMVKTDFAWAKHPNVRVFSISDLKFACAERDRLTRVYKIHSKTFLSTDIFFFHENRALVLNYLKRKSEELDKAISAFSENGTMKLIFNTDVTVLEISDFLLKALPSLEEYNMKFGSLYTFLLNPFLLDKALKYSKNETKLSLLEFAKDRYYHDKFKKFYAQFSGDLIKEGLNGIQIDLLDTLQKKVYEKKDIAQLEEDIFLIKSIETILKPILLYKLNPPLISHLREVYKNLIMVLIHLEEVEAQLKGQSDSPNQIKSKNLVVKPKEQRGWFQKLLGIGQ